jgi:hypothetical protein
MLLPGDVTVATYQVILCLDYWSRPVDPQLRIVTIQGLGAGRTILSRSSARDALRPLIRRRAVVSSLIGGLLGLDRFSLG